MRPCKYGHTRGRDAAGHCLDCSIVWQERKEARKRGEEPPARPDVCKNGHVRTPENTSLRNGYKRCLVCARASAKRSWERSKGLAVEGLVPRGVCRCGTPLEPGQALDCRACVDWMLADVRERRAA